MNSNQPTSASEHQDSNTNYVTRNNNNNNRRNPFSAFSTTAPASAELMNEPQFESDSAAFTTTRRSTKALPDKQNITPLTRSSRNDSFASDDISSAGSVCRGAHPLTDSVKNIDNTNKTQNKKRPRVNKQKQFPGPSLRSFGESLSEVCIEFTDDPGEADSFANLSYSGNLSMNFSRNDLTSEVTSFQHKGRRREETINEHSSNRSSPDEDSHSNYLSHEKRSPEELRKMKMQQLKRLSVAKRSLTKKDCYSSFYNLRLFCGAIVNDYRVQRFIITLIVLNAILMGIATFDFVTDNDIVARRFDAADTTFLVVFTIELGMQIIYHGSALWNDSWLLFDLIIILLSWAFAPLQVIRTFRIFRAIRLISRMDILKNLVIALILVAPSVAAIISLLILVIYIYGVFCTQLFEDTEYFDNLFTSFFTLFEMMTLEWSNTARDVGRQHSYAWVVFTTFTCITSFILYSLIVAVVCDAVTSTERKDERESAETEKIETRLRIIRLQKRLDFMKNEQVVLLRTLQSTVLALENTKNPPKATICLECLRHTHSMESSRHAATCKPEELFEATEASDKISKAGSNRTIRWEDSMDFDGSGACSSGILTRKSEDDDSETNVLSQDSKQLAPRRIKSTENLQQNFAKPTPIKLNITADEFLVHGKTNETFLQQAERFKQKEGFKKAVNTVQMLLQMTPATKRNLPLNPFRKSGDSQDDDDDGTSSETKDHASPSTPTQRKQHAVQCEDNDSSHRREDARFRKAVHKVQKLIKQTPKEKLSELADSLRKSGDSLHDEPDSDSIDSVDQVGAPISPSVGQRKHNAGSTSVEQLGGFPKRDADNASSTNDLGSEGNQIRIGNASSASTGLKSLPMLPLHTPPDSTSSLFENSHTTFLHFEDNEDKKNDSLH